MLSPHTLSNLAHTRIRSVQLRPMVDRQGISGNQLLVVETGGNARFVLKRMGWERDWIMRASNDRYCRSVMLWQSGLLDELEPGLTHGIIACAHDGDGWAILMHDFSQGLQPCDRHIDPKANEDYLRSLAHLHAYFWESPLLEQPEVGLCTLPELTAVTTSSSHSIAKYAEGFQLLPQIYEPDVAEILCRLISDPQPLFKALAHYPRTLVHGDFKMTNLAWNVSPQLPVVAFDWQMAAVGIPTMEVMWYYGLSTSPPAPLAQCIQLYHAFLAQQLGSRWDESRWQALLAIGILTATVRTCCNTAYQITYSTSQAVRDNLCKHVPIWSDWVRAGVKWL